MWDDARCILRQNVYTLHKANNKDDNNNVIKKEAEKIFKDKDRTTEIQRMCNVKIKVVPAIIEITGIISKHFRKYLSNIPGKRDTKEVQKNSESSHVKVKKVHYGK